MFTYQIFGLTLCANQPTKELCPISHVDNCDITVSFGERPAWKSLSKETSWVRRYTSHRTYGNNLPTLIVDQSVHGEHFRFSYSDGTEFFIEKATGHIWSIWSDNLTLEDATTYLFGPVLGFILRLRSITCLHGSAFVVHNSGLALVGPSQSGKSTTAAALAQKGFPVLSDDVLPITREHGQAFIQPGYPRLRLWPDSVEILFGAPEKLPLITPNWDKRFLDLSADRYQFQDRPLPLGTIYLLGRRTANLPAPRIERLTSVQAFAALTANTYANYLLDQAMRAQEFAFLSWLVGKVPIRLAVPHSDPSLLSSLCEKILDDYNSDPSRN